MRSFTSALLLVAAAAPLGAQLIESRKPSLSDQWTVGFDFFGGIPVGAFKDAEDGGAGGEVTVGFQPFRRQPLVMRLSGGGMKYGSEKAFGYQEVCGDTGCWVEEVEYDARTHSMWHFQIGPEFMATAGAWRPFTFALVGRTFFSSRANDKPTTPGGVETSRSLFSSNNFSTAYGAGIRRMLSVDGRELGLEFSARVARNVSARYVTESGVQRQPDGSFIIAPQTGSAHVLGLHVGFWVGPRVLWSER